MNDRVKDLNFEGSKKKEKPSSKIPFIDDFFLFIFFYLEALGGSVYGLCWGRFHLSLSLYLSQSLCGEQW